MTTYGAAMAAKPVKPAGMVVVPPSAFADEWPGKPADDVAIGLRLLSERDVQTARAEAAKVAAKLMAGADEMTDDVVAAYNDALMRYAVARGTCDVNDVRKPYFEMAEDVVQDALTSGGLRQIWNALERMTVAESPIAPSASDHELAVLGMMLMRDEPLVGLDGTAAATVRKFLGYALRELAATSVDDVGESVYQVREG